jgi:hypothetical protein
MPINCSGSSSSSESESEKKEAATPAAVPKKRQRDEDNESTASPDGGSTEMAGVTPVKQPATKRSRDRTPGTPFCRVDVEGEIEEHVKSGKHERFLDNTYEGTFGGKLD